MRSDRRIKIAVVDSGITAGHIHVGGIAGGVSFTADDGVRDRLGHGTAVAGAIRQWAPDAEIYAVKVFDQRLSATIETLLRAVAWCREQAMDIVNLSLGTVNPAHRDRFATMLDANLLIVSPMAALPGSLPDAIGVEADAACPRDAFRYRGGIFYASPFPRPIPDVPVERNLSGVSFAVANVTGLAARSGQITREGLIRSAAQNAGS